MCFICEGEKGRFLIGVRLGVELLTLVGVKELEFLGVMGSVWFRFVWRMISGIVLCFVGAEGVSGLSEFSFKMFLFVLALGFFVGLVILFFFCWSCRVLFVWCWLGEKFVFLKNLKLLRLYCDEEFWNNVGGVEDWDSVCIMCVIIWNIVLRKRCWM